jgi:tetratricopeptide (TPR) repeat protein
MMWFRRRRRASVIALADKAREWGNWSDAARLYRRALDRNPDRPAIWVQYGHALKESGLLAEAEAAYLRAIGYDRRDPDAYLQLGHVLKLRGAADRAQQSYLRAFALDPRQTGALVELQNLGWSAGHLRALQQFCEVPPEPATAAPISGSGFA